MYISSGSSNSHMLVSPLNEVHLLSTHCILGALHSLFYSVLTNRAKKEMVTLHLTDGEAEAWKLAQTLPSVRDGAEF